MGMYDSVKFKCPDPLCNGDVVVQSKAGACVLDTFPQEDVPSEIAKDIVDWVDTCYDCGKKWKVKAITPIVAVEMVLVDPEEDNDE